LRRKGFIEFVAFVAFIRLMVRKQAEGSIPMTLNNTINPKNTMNKESKIVRSEGDTRVRGELMAISIKRHPSLIAFQLLSVPLAYNLRVEFRRFVEIDHNI
jgi:hypothetical protein